MWRTISIAVAFFVALLVSFNDGDPSAADDGGDGQPQCPAPDEVAVCSNAAVASQQSPARAALALTTAAPGIEVGRTPSTVVVIAQSDLVDYRASDGRRRSIDTVAGDIVVNANWFTAGGSQAPVVVDGVVSGGPDTLERGQILRYGSSCSDHTPGQLHHVWMGETFQPDGCASAAVSGVSIVHKGLRADAYPGIDLTSGYTNTSRSHSFIGFNEHEIIVIATTGLSASELADFAISVGATEGVMLDGGGSTQIRTPTESIWSERPVTAFAVLESRR